MVLKVYNKVFNYSGLSNGHFLLVLCILIALIPFASAAATVTAKDVLIHLQASAGPIIKLTTAISYAIGFWFAISAIKSLKALGQSHGMSPGGEGLGGPLVRFVIGLALIYLPSTLSVATATLWGSSSAIGYNIPEGQFTEYKRAVLILIQTIGVIAFIRGLIVLANSTQPGAQQGSLGKGIGYIVGGILATHITATIDVLEATLGISF